MEHNKRFININNCNHYFLNESGSEQMFYLDSLFFVEEDTDTEHPLGIVYKPKHCLDTPIRFVRQPNHSFFMFNLKDWNNKDNLYVKKGWFMSKIRVGNKQNSFLNGEWAGHVRGKFKKITSGIRRAVSKKIIINELKENKNGES
jgi:hypothetical protein